MKILFAIKASSLTWNNNINSILSSFEPIYDPWRHWVEKYDKVSIDLDPQASDKFD